MRLASTGIPSSEELAHRLTVALDGFLEFWSRETLPFVAGGGSELRFLEAPYGRGKTHLLLLMAKTARQSGFATALVECSPESKPFASIERTYRSMIPALRFPSAACPEGLDLFEFLRTCPQNHLECLRESDRINPGFRNVLFAYARTSRAEAVNRPVLDGLASLIRSQPENPVRIPLLYRQDHRLPRPLGKLTKRTAMPWLRGLLQMPQTVGLKGLVVLFDETGADFHLGRESLSIKRAHFAHLRNLIDHLGVGRLPGCAITYAVAADLIQQARETLLPLAQRVERVLPEDANPRAVWSFLEELTEPQTNDPEFFRKLGQRLVDLGRQCGFEEYRLAEAATLLAAEPNRRAASINNASVREFIKLMAATITG